MRKIITSLIITSALLQAQEINNEKFQLIAKDIDSKDKVITAVGDVVIYSPTYYLSADKIIFDQDNETFELFDNVLIIKDNNIQTQSNYAFVDLKNDVSKQYPTFLYENSSNIWVNTKESNKNKELVDLESSIISSCDCEDPVWSIRASSMDYDTEKMWINTYNSRLYVKDVPVFYTPYFGFPTDTTRRTGLLIPTIGYSGGEGFRYSQPIFFAPADNYDFELIPQIRTNRGEGAYGIYRYADSPDSMLKIKTGYFNEKSSYMEEEGLKNSEDYGADLEYSRRNLYATKERPSRWNLRFSKIFK
ncbi:LPS-assembly protein LptD [Aliarcobacter butzleri]|uniref:LPS-assembly protein LptD n=1 Tax=Aliarcobacter butzleri TaxID=28197 RepID=UPI003AFB4DDF